MDAQPKLIPITLKGDNYFYWTKAATAALTSRGLWEHISSDQPAFPPQEVAIEGETPEQIQLRLTRHQQAVLDFNKWKQQDSQALVILQGSLDPYILQSFISHGTTKSLWEALQRVYGNLSNVSRIFELKRKLFHLQQNDQPFNKIQGDFCALWAELEEIRPTSIDPHTIMERAQEDKVFSILSTLNASFNDLIYHVLRQDKLPPFEELCMMIKREEGGRNLFSGPHELAHYVHKPSAPRSSSKERRNFYCEHCKRQGHTRDQCWILNPHMKPSRYKEPPRRGSAMTAGHDTMPTENNISLTNDELKGLKHLLQSINTDSGNFTRHSSIIIDSGATTHMFCDSSWFEHITPSHGVVSVANGKSVAIKGIGPIKLFNHELMALYIPDFHANLLSISKLVEDSTCRVIFDTNGVSFQDINSDRVFGKGTRTGNLFYLEDSHSSFLSVSPSVWHARFGHPHAKVFRLLVPHVKTFDHFCEAWDEASIHPSDASNELTDNDLEGEQQLPPPHHSNKALVHCDERVVSE
ncbi:PREDICTED: uncharacterized protein LOC109116022 [Tarenaya hassleriana]|uniref:uncharacterized protein LOC109116022 n=1 Tax=Tarenaya hassleriana TaxID=28532 RepID=UPI0008FD2354|nr:PREDICTED: uncharacterized protein LOC109116022 [Tarenaya hassleriana]